MEDDKPKTQGPERLRTVYVVEVDAKKAVADWRVQGRRARSWPVSVLWS
jgi:hypothetical protein